MTTFNFTVRATDDRGAFADRDFSIKVRNTIIDRYMAMGTAGLYTSPDAATWTLRPGIGNAGSAATNAQTEIVNGNGRWIMAKDATNYLMSLDGVNWAPYPLPAYIPVFNAGLQPRFGYGNGKFVLSMFHNPSGTANYVYKVFTSADGITWTTMFAGITTASVPGGLVVATNSTTPVYSPPPVYGNGRWTIVNPLSPSQFFTSTDGLTTLSIVSHPLTNLTSLVYINGLWVATGANIPQVATSVDGVVWSLQTLPTGFDGNHRISKILYGNGRIVLVPSHYASINGTAAETSFVFTSLDGVTFTKVNTNIILSAYNGGIQSSTGTFHNGLFLIGSAGATGQGIISSEDGLVWTRVAGIPTATAIGNMGSINQD